MKTKWKKVDTGNVKKGDATYVNYLSPFVERKRNYPLPTRVNEATRKQEN